MKQNIGNQLKSNVPSVSSLGSNWYGPNGEVKSQHSRNWKNCLVDFFNFINIDKFFLFTVALYKHPNVIIIIKQKKQKFIQILNNG